MVTKGEENKKTEENNTRDEEDKDNDNEKGHISQEVSVLWESQLRFIS